MGVSRVPPGGGEPELLVEDFSRPNGLCVPPDESVLYVDGTERFHVRSFGVTPDGSAAEPCCGRGSAIATRVRDATILCHPCAAFVAGSDPVFTEALLQLGVGVRTAAPHQR